VDESETDSNVTHEDVRTGFESWLALCVERLYFGYCKLIISEMDADLVRMKTYIETGRPPHDAANPLPHRPESTFTRAKQNETTVGQLSHLAGGP
jgi:hypothetical protein